MLLGRPWFKTAKLKQDWEKQKVILKKVKKIVIIPMVSKETLPTSIKPMMAQTINLEEDVEDDEEDLFLAANPTIIPVFEVDVLAIVNQYAEVQPNPTL